MRKNAKLLFYWTLTVLLTVQLTLVHAQQAIPTIERGPLRLGPSVEAGIPPRVSLFGSALDLEYEEKNVVLFYNPAVQGPSLTLIATEHEYHEARPSQDPLAFTSYKWFYMGQDYNNPVAMARGNIPQSGLEQVSNRLQVQNLNEGYHVFKVQGFIVPPGSDPDLLCPPEDEEYYVVYVLPELQVEVTRMGDMTKPLQFCESDDAQDWVQLSAKTNYANYVGEPDLNDFDIRYKWYSVLLDGQVVSPIVDPTKSDISKAWMMQENVATGGSSTSNEFRPNNMWSGRYKFFVEVEYVLKDRDYDGAETLENRKRTYALYRGWFGGPDEASATEVLVTPRPGKPFITIEGVQD